MDERVPIAEGFRIWFSKDGRALHCGREEPLALPTVLSWLDMHPEHRNRELVERWALQKEKQIGQANLEQEVEAKRKALNAQVDRTARESRLRDPEMIEIARAEMFRIRGVPQGDD